MIEQGRISVKPGTELYESMKKSQFNFKPVLHTAVEHCGVDSEEDASNLLNAFLQWLAVLPAKDKDALYVMLKSDVDRIFHAFVLNTQLYQQFCDKYLGHFVHHTPIEDAVSKKWVEYTVNLLDTHYGENLHPSLKYWRELCTTDAWKVSCGSC